MRVMASSRPGCFVITCIWPPKLQRWYDPELAALYCGTLCEGTHYRSVIVAIATNLPDGIHAILNHAAKGDDPRYVFRDVDRIVLTH